MRITNAKIMTMEGQPCFHGYVEIEGGRISSLGPGDSPLRSGKEELDARGGYVLPGIIDPHVPIIADELSSSAMPHLRAQDGIVFADERLAEMLASGVTSVVCSPGAANVIGGAAAAIKTHGDSLSKALVKPYAYLKMAMGRTPIAALKPRGPVSNRECVATIRNLLFAASTDRGEYNIRGKALRLVAEWKKTAFINTEAMDDLLHASRLAQEVGIKVVALCRYKVTHSVAGLHGIVLTQPLLPPEDLPCPIAISAGSDWPRLASLLAAAGMEEQEVFRALTINPARMVGMDDRVGSLAVGKDADVVVFSGHPFHYKTRIQAVFVGGFRVK